MKHMELTNSESGIENVAVKIEGNRCMITWNWPADVSVVYIYKIRSRDRENSFELEKEKLKLYTREEYRNRGYYGESIQEIDEFTYIIYPCVEEQGQLILLEQKDKRNEVNFCTGRREIKYRIREKNKLFSNKKQVEITIYLEADLEKEVLCYVSKRGAYPLKKEDGTIYYFPNALHIGKNEMPAILVHKEEHINLFFTKEEYRRIYQLIPI